MCNNKVDQFTENIFKVNIWNKMLAVQMCH